MKCGEIGNSRKCFHMIQSVCGGPTTGWVSVTLPCGHTELSSLHPVSHLFPPGSFLNGRTDMLPCLSKFSSCPQTLIFCYHVDGRYSERIGLDGCPFTREII